MASKDIRLDAHAAYQTVEIFAAITGKPLTLSSGKPKSTGPDITVPLDERGAYLLVERQLGHILFGSDPVAVEQLARSLGNLTERQAKKRGFDSRDFETLPNRISELCWILEAHRVLSLWGLLYEGSADQIRLELIRRLKLDTDSGPVEGLLSVFGRIALGVPFDPQSFARFVPALTEALNRVQRRDFGATLIVGRWLVSELIEVLKPPSGFTTDMRLAALRDLLCMMGWPTKEETAVFSNVAHPGKYPDALRPSVRTALGANLKDTSEVDALLENEGEVATNQIEELKQGLNRRHQSFQKDPAVDSYIVRFKRLAQDGKSLLPELEYPEDRRAVQRLQEIFMRRLGRQEHSLDESGVEIDVAAWIERRATRNGVPFFRSTQPMRGFKALLLVDRSGSMLFQDRILQAQRAVRILRKAMQFPGVTLDIWGFQAPEEGVVEIVDFRSLEPCLHTKQSQANGGTPLPAALKLAIDELNDEQSAKHLVCVTDGAPMAETIKGRRLSPVALQIATRIEVERAVRLGIGVSFLLVGSKDEKGRAQFEVSRSEVEAMLGSSKRWRTVHEGNFLQALVEVVSLGFERHLVRSG